ncbi:hypothetical protein G6F59_015803 [Rhizopus arrhizus]|nr:hypothetical protein G6F59_015803 [Rhizopus arrhizus]
MRVQVPARLHVVDQQVADDMGQAVEGGIARGLDLQPILMADAVAAVLGQPTVDVVAGHECAQFLTGGRLDQAHAGRVDGPAGPLRADLARCCSHRGHAASSG